MRDLHAALSELRIDWPETPDVTSTVAARIAGEPRPHPRRRRRFARPARPALAFALALLLLASAAVAAIPDARHAVLDALGLRGVRVERGPVTATPEPRSGLGDDLALGRAVDFSREPLPDGMRFRLPTSLGPPDAAYLDTTHVSPIVSYVYRERRGIPRAEETGVALIISVLRGSFTPGLEKTLAPGTHARRLRIDGQPALHLSGAVHGFAYATESGNLDYVPSRLATDTLLAERGELVIRIEGRISRERAVRLARELSVGP